MLSKVSGIVGITMITGNIISFPLTHILSPLLSITERVRLILGLSEIYVIRLSLCKFNIYFFVNKGVCGQVFRVLLY